MTAPPLLVFVFFPASVAAKASNELLPLLAKEE